MCWPKSGSPLRLRADAALLGITIIWGTTFVIIKDALESVGPLTFLALRFGLAALALCVLFLSRRPALNATNLRAGLVLGSLLCAGYALQTAGLQLTSAARTAFVNGMQVVLVPLVVAIPLRRHVPRGVWVGVGLATLGLALLSIGPALLAGGFDTVRGDLLVLIATVLFAWHIVLTGEFGPHVDAPLVTLLQMAWVSVVCFVGAGLFEQPSLDAMRSVLGAAAFTGVFATSLAYTVQMAAQRHTSATHAALIFSGEPVFGALFAVVFAGEVLGPAALVGCGLILAGMLVAQFGDHTGR